MDPIRAALNTCASPDPDAAFAALADALAGTVALRLAVWVARDGESVRSARPAGSAPPPELLRIAAHLRAAEVLPFAAVGGRAAERGDEVLLVPVACGDAAHGALALAAPAGAFGDDPAAWTALGEALARTCAREAELRALRAERDALCARAEEMEALEVLGLAANRTLDPDEVVALVARFTRTLLGADSVVVHVAEDGEVRPRAAVGLGTEPPAGDPFAARVVAEGRPLRRGARDGDAGADGDGMRAELGVPLSLFGESFGALVVGRRGGGPFTDDDARLAVTLARHAAVAISNARLHGAVAARSDELEHAYAQLRRAADAKERFFNTMSHELRTPVSALKGYNELLLEGVAGELPERARHYLERSGRAAQGLLHLVNELLDLARLEAGRVEVEPRPCALADVVEDVLSTVQPQAAEKGLTLHVPALRGLPPLHTDPRRVRQILTNVLGNAVKFTEAGSVTVAVRSEEGDDGGWMEVRVSDTGPGIPPEARERVFDEYAQLPGSTGTGLGLPISLRLARLLGGDLAVESEVGVGSTFVLRLPAAPAGAELHAAAS